MARRKPVPKFPEYDFPPEVFVQPGECEACGHAHLAMDSSPEEALRVENPACACGGAGLEPASGVCSEWGELVAVYKLDRMVRLKTSVAEERY